jgi:hypothetical protein
LKLLTITEIRNDERYCQTIKDGAVFGEIEELLKDSGCESGKNLLCSKD